MRQERSGSKASLATVAFGWSVQSPGMGGGKTSGCNAYRWSGDFVFGGADILVCHRRRYAAADEFLGAAKRSCGGVPPPESDRSVRPTEEKRSCGGVPPPETDKNVCPPGLPPVRGRQECLPHRRPRSCVKPKHPALATSRGVPREPCVRAEPAWELLLDGA